MMTFSTWLEAKGPVGGAFGKKSSHNRWQHNYASYDQRIAFGLSQEQKILKAAKNICGLDITGSSENQDKYLKIDGWWRKEGRLIPVQIKYRDSGEDLLFEVIRPFVSLPLLSKANRLGRDMKPAGHLALEFDPNNDSGPQYIIHLSQQGNKLTILAVKPCYQIILNMIHKVDVNPLLTQQIEGKNSILLYSDMNGILRLQTDNANGMKKVMAYLPLKSAGIVQQCNVSIKIG